MFRVDRVFEMIRSSYLGGLSRTEWRAKLRASLEAVALEPADVLGKYPHQLSGGQLQRLLIARALLLEIRFLVADEIISMLDASTRIDVLNLLGDLKARGLGILFVTHDLSLGNYISDQTVILRRGVVVERGATEKVFGDPSAPVHEDAHRLRAAAQPQVDVQRRSARRGRRGAGGRPRRGRARPLGRSAGLGGLGGTSV